MNEIRLRVRQAQRRLTLQRFLRALPICLAVTLALALVGVLWPKLTYVPSADDRWPWYWLGGGALAGVLTAGAWTWLGRRRTLEAAIEIDRRFGLKERISSTWTLDESTRHTPAGEALVADAERAAGRIDVPAAFPVRLPRHGWLPIGVALLAVALALGLDNATPKKVAASSANRHLLKKEIDKAVQDLKKKMKQRQMELEQKGLAESKELFETLQKKLDDLQKKNQGDYKKTFVEINNLAKEIEKRRKELGGAKEIQEKLQQQLKDVSEGPAEKLNRALTNGRWNEAKELAKKLAEKLEKNQLSPQEKEQLKKQLQQLQKQLEQLQRDYEQAKQDLKEQIRKAQEAGDRQTVNELQKKLDQLERQKKQMDRLSELAQKLGQCQQCVGNNDGKGAAQAMKQMAQAMEEMEAEAQELQSLSEALEELEQCKEGLAKACQNSRGMGKGSENSFEMPEDRMSLGKGRGRGPRPEEEGKTGGYKSRVRARPKKGEVVRTGDAGGPNRKGQSAVQAAEQVESAFKEDPDPIVQEKLPRMEKRQATEYFEKLRRGQ